jgi:NMD protein affecting ribosome stability and mRNA decay
MENGELCPQCERHTVKIVYTADGIRIEFCRLCQTVFSQVNTEGLFKTIQANDDN